MKYEIDIEDKIFDSAYTEWYEEAKKKYAGSVLKRLFYNIWAIMIWFAIWCFVQAICLCY